MTAAQFAGLLNARQTAPDKWLAKCVAHRDRSPSLSIKQAEGKILLKCMAGCPTEAILNALDLNWSDLFDNDHHHWQRRRPPRPNPTPAPDLRTVEQKLADAILADPPERTPRESLMWDGIDDLYIRNKMIARAEKALKADPESELGWALLSEAYYGMAELEHQVNALEGGKSL